ncbi:MAG: hypothetical protein MR420_10265, partial [Spirochaetia bacterium]|nr:hypothetical protein [Spirochaetia bacterium]
RMRMAKSIANEIISYKVIPQSLPKIKFWQKRTGRRKAYGEGLNEDIRKKIFERYRVSYIKESQSCQLTY